MSFMSLKWQFMQKQLTLILIHAIYFEENHMQVQPWVSIGYYKDEDLIVLRSMISADK